MINFLHIVYLLLLIFAPLAFGFAQYWSLLTFSLLALLLMGLLFANQLARGLPLVRVPGLLPLLIIAAWVVLQLIPLPAGLVALISPETHAIYNGTRGIVQPLDWMPISLYPKATISDLFRLVTYIAFYVLSVQLLVHKRYLRTTVNAATAYLTLLALFNLVGRYSGLGNQMVGLFVMMLPVMASLFLYKQPSNRYQSTWAWLHALSFDRILVIYTLLGLAVGVSGVSAFLSLSRTAIIFIGIALFLLSLGLIKAKGLRRRGFKRMAGAALVAILIGWLGWQPMIQRFDLFVVDTPNANEHRADIWQDSFHIATDFPLTGTGFNTFETIFPAYQTFMAIDSVRGAKNDFIELLVTGGGIAIALMAWFVVTLLREIYPAFRRRREPYCRFLFMSAAAGLVGFGLFSLFETSFRYGINGFYCFFLFSLLVSAAHTRLHTPQKATSLGAVPIERALVICGPVLAAVIIGCLMQFISIHWATRQYDKVADLVAADTLTPEQYNQMTAHLTTAAKWDPFDPAYPLILARAAAQQGDHSTAEVNYRKALQRSPLSAVTLRAYGRLLGQASQADQAEKLLLAAIRFSGNDADGYVDYARWLVAAGRLDDAMAQMRLAMLKAPEQARLLVDAMNTWGVSVQTMASSIPDAAIPCLSFAQFLEEKGNDELAEAYFRKSLTAAARSTVVDADPFNRLYRYYAGKDRWEEALKVLQQGVEALPTDSGLRMMLATTYEQQGIHYRAVEEYRQALMLNPRDEGARAALDRLTK
jgi:tetratricopeptide (TPR) repeat protein/O-antigen ligase